MADLVNNGQDHSTVDPSAATNDEAGFSSFAKFEAEMATDPNAGKGAAEVQNDGGVRDASQIKPKEDEVEEGEVEEGEGEEVAAAGEPVEEGKGPAKPSMKTRLGQLVRERHEADARERQALERAEAAEARAKDLEENPPAKAKPVVAKEAPTSDRPNAEDFEFGEYDPEYQDAIVEWRVEQSMAKRDAKAAEATAAEANRAAETERTSRWRSAIEKGATANEDFEAKVLNGTSDWKLSKQMWEMSVDSDVGHAVLYHLASDPAESARIFNLPLTRQAAEFGKLEARFSQPSGEQPKSGVKEGASGHMPSAPKPISQVRGASGQYKTDAGTKDFAAFEALMKAEDAARNAAKQ